VHSGILHGEIELRKTLLLSLDDLLVITQKFINKNVSRSALNRCLPPWSWKSNDTEPKGKWHKNQDKNLQG